MRLFSYLLFAITTVTLMPAPSAFGETDTEAKPVLTKGDIERFIETFPAMSEKLQALRNSLDQVQNPSLAKAMMADEKVQAIMQQYGWKTETYFHKMTTITMGFAQAKMTAELAKMPAEQRAMMEQMMQQQMGSFNVHPKDVAMIEPQMAKLEKLFDSM